jgi:ribosomal protein S18 acetylase RimI-like enzyme
MLRVMADTEAGGVAQVPQRPAIDGARYGVPLWIPADAVGVPVGAEVAETAAVVVHEARADDQPAVDAYLEARGTAFVARRGELIDARQPPALLAWLGGRIAGVLTWIVDGDAFEVLTLHVDEPWHGTGTALLDGARRLAASLECRRMWLVTTNDNVDALRFYQRRGFRIVDVRPGAVDLARAHLKPAIPEFGEHAIPVRDELELELELVTRSGAVPPIRMPRPVGEEILALELALASRDEAAIPGGYEAALDDGFREIGTGGRTWTRDAVLAALARASHVEGVSIEEFECSTVAPDVALATYDLLLPGPGGIPAWSRRSSVWTRRDGRWRLRFHQGTPAPAEEP